MVGEVNDLRHQHMGGKKRAPSLNVFIVFAELEKKILKFCLGINQEKSDQK